MVLRWRLPVAGHKVLRTDWLYGPLLMVPVVGLLSSCHSALAQHRISRTAFPHCLKLLPQNSDERLGADPPVGDETLCALICSLVSGDLTVIRESALSSLLTMALGVAAGTNTPIRPWLEPQAQPFWAEF